MSLSFEAREDIPTHGIFPEAAVVVNNPFQVSERLASLKVMPAQNSPGTQPEMAIVELLLEAE